MFRAIGRIIITFLLHVGLFVSLGWAQEPTTQPSPSTQPTIALNDSIQILTDSIPLKDSLNIDSSKISLKRPPKKKQRVAKKIVSDEVFYFYHDQPSDIFEFADTTISTSFFQYDPARSGKYDFATLGAPGGPMQALHYKWEDRYGSRAGIDVFKPYIRDESDLPFYTKSKAFTDVYYSQGTEQNDHVFHGDFGRSFDNGVKFSISHDRLIHSLNNADLPLNSNAFVPYPSSKNTSLLTGLAFQREGSKYQGFITYAHNEINQLYSGGIKTTDTIRTIEILDSAIAAADSLEVGVSIPASINDQTSRLRYRLRTVAYHQYLTLLGKNDSTSVRSRIFNVNHKIKYSSDIYRFSDTQFNADYYQNLATDDRGLRVGLNQKILENYVGLSTIKTQNGKIVPSVLGAIRLGLRHQYANIDGEAYQKKFNNLFAEGAWKVNPITQVTLDVFGQIGLLDNIGDFRLNASANLDLGKWGSLEGRLRQQRYSPSLYEQQNFVTNIEVWNKDFDKSFNSELGFKYALPKYKLEAGLSYFLLDNHIYFNEQFSPIQRNGAINLLQVYLKKNFNWNIFHLENFVMLQSSTDNDVIRLPNWWSRHSLYAQRKIFKNIMLARFGLDLRLNASYYANNFNPALGQFFVQPDREIKLYPAVDAHFGFVVEKFRIFVKMENLTTLLTNDIFYQVPYYPQKEMAFRFGISWRFLDQNSNKRATRNGNDNSNNNSSRPPDGVGGRPRF